MHVPPVGQGLLGRRQAGGPVDGGAAADAAPLQHRDGLILGALRAGLLVQRRRLGLVLHEGARRVVAPSSIITTDSPARVGTSAVNPPPAPVPTITTSALSVRSDCRAAAS